MLDAETFLGSVASIRRKPRMASQSRRGYNRALMALKGTFRLPWTPVPGDFAPEWSATAEDGKVFTSDSTPGSALLLCFLSTREIESAASLLEQQLAAHTQGNRCPRMCVTCIHALVARHRHTASLPIAVRRESNYCAGFLPAAQGTGFGRTLVARCSRQRRWPHVIAAMNMPVSPTGARGGSSARTKPVALSLQLRAMHFRQFCICRDCFLRKYAGCSSMLSIRATPTPRLKMLRMQEGTARRVVDSERKQRRDFRIELPMRDWIWQQLLWRMAPAVRKAFHFDITRATNISRLDATPLKTADTSSRTS